MLCKTQIWRGCVLCSFKAVFAGSGLGWQEKLNWAAGMFSSATGVEKLNQTGTEREMAGA